GEGVDARRGEVGEHEGALGIFRQAGGGAGDLAVCGGHRDVAERVAARPDRSDDGAGALPHLDLHTAGRFASREPDEAGGGTEAVSAGRDEVAARGGEALDAPLAHVAGGGGAGGEGDRAVG